MDIKSYADRLFHQAKKGNLKKLKRLLRHKNAEEIQLLLNSRIQWCVFTSMVTGSKYWWFETTSGIKQNLPRLKHPVYGTLLTVACDLGHLKVVEYLIGTCQMNVNEPDTYGLTPIWHAISKKHLEVVKFLIQNGADLSIKSVFMSSLGCHFSQDMGNRNLLISTFHFYFELFKIIEADDVTPLLFAAIEGHKDIVMYLVALKDLVTEQEKIDALEMLGIYFFYIGDDTQAIEYWKQGIVHRCQHYDEDFIKNLHRSPDNTFNNSQELTSLINLEKLEFDHHAMCCQTVLKCERILGATHPITLGYIVYLGYFYISKLRYDDYINLWIYIRKHIQGNSPNGIVVPPIVQFMKLYFEFNSVYYKYIVKLDHSMLMKFLEQLILDIKLLIPAYAKSKLDAPYLEYFIYESLELSVMEFLLPQTLQFITLIHKKLPESDTVEYQKFYQAVCRLVKMDPRGRMCQSLLHISCDYSNYYSQETHYRHFADMDISYPKLIELLLEAGCNPNVTDAYGQSVLPDLAYHLARDPACFPKVKLLLEAGAHLDMAGECGIFQTNLNDNDIFDSLSPLKYTALTCLAARVITRHNMIDMVPKHLSEFVLQHKYSEDTYEFLQKYYNR